MWQSKNCKQGFLSAPSLNLSLNLSLPNWNRNVYIDYSVAWIIWPSLICNTQIIHMVVQDTTFHNECYLMQNRLW